MARKSLTRRMLNGVALVSAPGLAVTVLRLRWMGLRTLLSPRKLTLLAAAARHCSTLEGDYIEFGVFRGGSAAILGQPLKGTGKVLHLCDSFEGLPAPGELDSDFSRGQFGKTSAEMVREGLDRLGVPARLHVGWFSDTIPGLGDLRFALVHLDVDLYESFRECLEYCYPRMTPGALMLVDDYGGAPEKGGRRAIDEFFQDKSERVAPLTESQAAVRIGSDGSDLLRVLSRRAGWIPALPGAANALYRPRRA